MSSLIDEEFEPLEEKEERYRDERGLEATPKAEIQLGRNFYDQTPKGRNRSLDYLFTSTSLKNVFDCEVTNYKFTESVEINRFQNEETLNLNNFTNLNECCEVDILDPLRNETIQRQERILLEEESTKVMNAELQKIISSYKLIKNRKIETKKNFEEFKLDSISKEIQKDFEFKKGTNLRTQSSLIFYNLLMVSQKNQLSLKQNAPFNKLYLVKV